VCIYPQAGILKIDRGFLIVEKKMRNLKYILSAKQKSFSS